MKCKLLLVSLFVIFSSVGSYADEDSLYFEWETPLGVTFTIDKNGVDVSASKSYLTFLGKFSIGYNKNAIDFEEGYTYVIIKDMNKKNNYFFEINNKKTLNIISNSCSTRIKIKGNQFELTVKKGEICSLNIQVEELQNNSKWIKPSNRVCINSGGIINQNGLCEASWSDAKNICTSSGEKLPTFNTLKNLISDCGGIVINSNLEVSSLLENQFNSKYHNCIESKGLMCNAYWSSSEEGTFSGQGVNFDNGWIFDNLKVLKRLVHCVKK